MLPLETPLEQLKGIGPKFVLKLKKLEIHTVRDLLWHFPSRYEDFSQIYTIDNLEPGQQVTIKGVVDHVSSRQSWRRKMTIVEAHITDETGTVKALWFNQPYLKNTLRPGRYANFAGKVSVSDDEIYLSNPTYELLSQFREEGQEEEAETKHTARLVPIYPETKGLTSKGIRYLMSSLLPNISVQEFLPAPILKKHLLLDIGSAIEAIHFPERIEDALKARERFAFENLFLLHLANARHKLAHKKEKAKPIAIADDSLASALAKLPFTLTASQDKSVREIYGDLSRQTPMNRLLQGDVGSGKTIVAALAAIQVARSGLQVAFMAPTEILARQHFETFKKFFGNEEVGIGFLSADGARIFYGTNLEQTAKKQELLKAIKDHRVRILIGTHALIQNNVAFSRLGLVVIDEQHRFGVAQRASLLKHQVGGLMPHFLSMSATPIPRTLMMTLFGDLDVSLIDEVPKGRKPIITKIVSPENRRSAYGFVKGELQKGRQAFVICPRIEPGEDTGDLLALEMKTVKEEYEKLSKNVFPEFRVGMLHGKMKSKEKAEIMRKFSARELDMLVSTSVIEVGVDIPNATLMLIEGSERFGLAQLYQFRGRIGRGDQQSFCLLFTDSSSDTAQSRLKALIQAKNGFELAEQDLALRGPGEFIGRKQTGTPDFVMRSIQNMGIIKESRDAALAVLEKDPELTRAPLLAQKLNAFQTKVHLE